MLFEGILKFPPAGPCVVCLSVRSAWPLRGVPLRVPFGGDRCDGVLGRCRGEDQE